MIARLQSLVAQEEAVEIDAEELPHERAEAVDLSVEQEGDARIDGRRPARREIDLMQQIELPYCWLGGRWPQV